MKKYFFLISAFVVVGTISCRKDTNLGPIYYVPAAAFNNMYGQFMNQQILLGTGNIIDNTDKGIDLFSVGDKRGNATLQYINWGGEIAPHNEELYLPSQDIPFSYAKVRKDVYGNANVWHFQFPAGAMLYITEHRFYEISLLSGDYVCQKVGKKPNIFTYTYIGPRTDVTVTWTMFTLEDGGLWKEGSDSTSVQYIDADSLGEPIIYDQEELLQKKNSIVAQTANEPEIQN
jgi:hypothetical protein